MSGRGPYVTPGPYSWRFPAPSVAPASRLLGPAGGPTRPAPGRTRRLDPGAVVGAPARPAPARAGKVQTQRRVGRAPRRAAPGRARVVDVARGRADERVRGQGLVGLRHVAGADGLDRGVDVECREAPVHHPRRVDQDP